MLRVRNTDHNEIIPIFMTQLTLQKEYNKSTKPISELLSELSKSRLAGFISRANSHTLVGC